MTTSDSIIEDIFPPDSKPLAWKDVMDGTGYDICFKKLHEDAVIPTKGTTSSAGFDLRVIEEVTLDPNEIMAIPLGFATALHEDIHCRIESRSGMALRGLVVLTGVIDADYRGEWKVILMNLSGKTVTLAKGDRIAQAVFRPTLDIAFETVSELPESNRTGGFGSTGR